MANKKLKQIQVKETTYDIDVATSLKVTNLSAENINENNVVTAGAVKGYAAEKGHTHPVQESVSGNAGSADKLNTDAGSVTQPVYFKDGVPVATTYALNKTVPADAKFTDEDTKNTAGATDTSSKIFLIGATAQTNNPQTYSHDTAYIGTDGCLYSNSKKVSVEGHGTHVTYATANPGMDGTAAVGTSAKVAREDHIHPVDTSRAAKSTVDNHISNTEVHFTTAERNKLSGIESGAQVNTITGVKGNSETKYRTGNVNITKANIGLSNVDNTADVDKSVSHADTAGSAEKATKDASGNVITATYATKNELSAHNSATDAHADIRASVQGLSEQVQGLLEVDGDTLEQMEALLKSLGDSETLIAKKIDKDAIVDNLTTQDATKVLSANQGVILSAAIDGVAGNLSSHGADTTVHITAAERTKWNAAKTHADAAHAPSDAEKNVQSDWNETNTSSDAFIKNKPSTMTPESHTHGNLANDGAIGIANAVVVTDGNKKLTASTSITTTELGYLNNARSNIQAQLDTVVHKYSQGLGFGFEVIDDETVAIVPNLGTCTDTDIIIPEYYDGKPVRVIDYGAFSGEDIRSITFPKNLRVIRDEAFRGCTSLESIIISDNVTYIGGNAFDGCTGLKKVVLGAGLNTIGSAAFSSCSSLASIVIPDSVTTIGHDAFYGCESLKSIVIPDSVTSIGEYAFQACLNLETVVLGNGVSTLPPFAFDNCSNLKNVTLGNQITVIEENAFSSCIKLKDIILPRGVKHILKSAFSGCLQLAHITIPDSIEVIDNAFDDCLALRDVYYLGSEEDWDNIEIYSENTCLTDATIHFNHASDFIDINTKVDGLDSQVTQEVVSIHAPRILRPEDVITDQYSGHNWIQSLSTSRTLAEEIVLPKVDKAGNPITGIGDNAFSGMTNLTKVIIPDSVTVISYRAFENCTNLVHVVIPDSVQMISDYAFGGCTGLKSVTIPDSVIAISDSAFAGCENLTSITIGNGVTDICDWTFQDCHNLTNIVIGGSVTTIGEGAFTFCSRLKSIVIPDSVTSIGYEAFRDCTMLKNVTLGSNISVIEESAFAGCALSYLVIPASVTAIGQGALGDNLKSIYYEGSEDSWGIINSSGTSAIVHCNYNSDLMMLHDRITRVHGDLQDCVDQNSNQLSNLSDDLETATDNIDALFNTADDLQESITDLGSRKVNGYINSLYNGTAGNPKPVKFATVNYTNCTSENGVAAKFGMRSGHGNGVSYVFDQDITINVDHLGNVSATVFKNSGAAVTYSGVSRQYGDVFYITDTSAKTVNFYCLMGQYAYLKMNTPTPLTSSSNAASSTVLVQHLGSGNVYGSGTITGWATTKQVGVQFSFDANNKTLTITT